MAVPAACALSCHLLNTIMNPSLEPVGHRHATEFCGAPRDETRAFHAMTVLHTTTASTVMIQRYMTTRELLTVR